MHELEAEYAWSVRGLEIRSCSRFNLSNGSRRILETLGVWPVVSGVVIFIRKIAVSDQGRFGFARVDAAEQGLAAMGYVVPNRSLGSALWARLAQSEGLRVFCPGQVMRVHSMEHAVELVIGEGKVVSKVPSALMRATAMRDSPPTLKNSPPSRVWPSFCTARQNTRPSAAGSESLSRFPSGLSLARFVRGCPANEVK